MKRKRRDRGLYPNRKTRRKNRLTVPSVACCSFDSTFSKAFILKNQNNSHKTFGEFKFDQSVFNNDYKKYKFANKE